VAERVSLAKRRPRLEGVFGPLTEEVDASLRVIFERVDATLRALATHHGTSGASLERTGLELTLFPSGQLEISSDVGASDGLGNIVAFMVELRPTWFYGVGSDKAGWDVEASIDADCRHTNDHGGMDPVFRGEVIRATDPEAAARALLGAAEELRRLGTTKPLSFWLDRARDAPDDHQRPTDAESKT